jgi:hypothetical protein
LNEQLSFCRGEIADRFGRVKAGASRPRAARGYDLDSSKSLPDWVICGGESGVQQARMMEPAWARAMRDQCQGLGIAFFMKNSTRSKTGRMAFSDRLKVGRAEKLSLLKLRSGERFFLSFAAPPRFYTTKTRKRLLGVQCNPLGGVPAE